MGENSVKTGKKLEEFGETLISKLGWIELTRNREIKCTRAIHTKKTHGIDLFCKFNNPYLNGNQGVIIECKNRQMQSINKNSIDEWLKELISTIECSQSTAELNDINIDDLKTQNTGLLLIHANENWDEKKFYNYLKEITVPNRKNPINVFIAANDKINLWTSLFNKIDKDYKDNFSFIYPSLNEYSKKMQNTLTINAMFSKYIFAQHSYTTTESRSGQNYELPHQQTIMFFLDEVNKNNFKYAWSMFKHYQLQGADKYVFIFYPRKEEDIACVRELFFSTIKEGDPHITEEEFEKISYDFLDNYSISPVEFGGAK